MWEEDSANATEETNRDRRAAQAAITELNHANEEAMVSMAQIQRMPKICLQACKALPDPETCREATLVLPPCGFRQSIVSCHKGAPSLLEMYCPQCRASLVNQPSVCFCL